MSNEAKREQIEAMYSQIRQSIPGVPEISAEELRDRLPTDDLVLVDVREPEERHVSRIRGSITGQQFEADAEAHRDKTIVVYCTIGGRSGKYSKMLHQQGWTVKNFKGSVLAWTHAGGELIDADDEPTKKVHTYSRKYDLVADDYEAVW